MHITNITEVQINIFCKHS